MALVALVRPATWSCHKRCLPGLLVLVVRLWLDRCCEGVPAWFLWSGRPLGAAACGACAGCSLLVVACAVWFVSVVCGGKAEALKP